MSKRETVILCVASGVVLIAIAIWQVCRKRPYIEIGTPYSGFVDKLEGVAYSKGSYDGIDVSKYQGTILWNEVAKDKKIKFVYVRATNGKDIVDSYYEYNIREAKEEGLKVGSYHFLTSKYSIDEQFKTFLSVANPSKQDLIPMIDVEDAAGKGYLKDWTKSQLQDSILKLSSLIEKHYGRKPMIYSNQSFYNDMLSPQFNDYIIYMANYSRSPIMQGHNSHNLWQYTDRGHIHGIGWWVDLCRFTNGTTLTDIRIKR